MDRVIEQVRSLLRHADRALLRQSESARTPKQRDDDFVEAQRAHRQAVAIIDALGGQKEIDEALLEALAPLQAEAADLAIYIAEIRFDEVERAYHHPS